MKLIYEQAKEVEQILSKQKISESEKYRRFFYLVELPVENGILLLNTITYELLLLNNEDKELLDKPEVNNSIIRYLIEQYFLVPEEFDDKKLAHQLENTRFMIKSIYTNVPYRNFVILPTTGCNARCFYCFEAGAKISNMTEQTAHDVADFIKKKGAESINITWFGGEPLINQKAIDTICTDLRENNIYFKSKMISNGYLFDEATIKKATELWNLKKVQITLDGTEEVYNKVKDYVYKNISSPFVKVLNNIENALKAGIDIKIRLNMDEHNADDLFALSTLLINNFNKYDNCYIYVVRLFDSTCSKTMNRTVDKRHNLIENTIKLQKYIHENMPKTTVNNLPKSFDNPNTCMANNDSSVMIVPDGHLGKCEHFVDSGFIGSIYNDELDLRKLTQYKERKKICDKCEDCEFITLCSAAKCCTGVPKQCDDMDKKAFIERLHIRLKNIYNKFIETENI